MASNASNAAEKAHIFYVEDDESLSFVTRDNLEIAGYKITHVADGGEALKILKSGQKFDLYIFDVMLPEVDGFSLAQEVRKRDEQVAIIFLTAKSLKQDKLHGLTLGGDELAKTCGIRLIPTIIVIGPDGRIRLAQSGVSPDEREMLIGLISDALPK